MSKKTDWTGERLETFVFNESTIEHLHRYALAMELATGKKVLDIACGEGYGSNLLAQKALHVTGMDIDKSSIEKAKEKYSKSNIEFKVSTAEKILAPDNEFDLVVSFETIEHLEEHAQLMRELKRVLKPEGLVIISTPDKMNYSDNRNYKNPFHKKELYRNEFEALLKTAFTEIKVLSQQTTYSSFISTDTTIGLDIYGGNYSDIKKNLLSAPLYWVALASDNQLPSIINSIFNGNSVVEQALYEREKMVRGTMTYRLGHFILYPFKIIKNIFKK